MSNFIFNLAGIPLDKQDPERKEKPDDEKDGHKNDQGNGDPERKLLKDLLDIPFHHDLYSPS